MIGSSPVILIYLNKQFEGVIIDKKVERERQHSQKLYYTIVVKLPFIYCQNVVFYCAN